MVREVGRAAWLRDVELNELKPQAGLKKQQETRIPAADTKSRRTLQTDPVRVKPDFGGFRTVPALAPLGLADQRAPRRCG